MNFSPSKRSRPLRFLIGVLAFSLLLISSAQAAPLRVAVVGSNLRYLAPFLTQAGMTAQAMDALPSDAVALADVADVVILSIPDGKTPLDSGQEQILESFVRAGGGLWVDAAHVPATGWLESMTAAIALDGRMEQWVPLDPAPGSPLADLDFKSLPRLSHGRSLAPPGSSQ